APTTCSHWCLRVGAAHTPRAVHTTRVRLGSRTAGNHLQASERQRLAGLQAAAVQLLRGERLIQRGNIALLDNPSGHLHYRLLLTIALGLPWTALSTQLVGASLLASDAVYERLQALRPLSTTLCRALNTVGISMIDVPVLANGRLELRYYLREQA